MSAFRAATLLLVVGWLWWALSALAGSRVSIRSPGAIASAPADWWITVTVERDADNRLLVVEVDGAPGEYRRSDYPLDGADAARVRQIWFKALPAGCYTFAATVHGNGQQLGAATTSPLHVIGLEGDPCG